MPPKRKRAEADETVAGATRAKRPTRSKNATGKEEVTLTKKGKPLARDESNISMAVAIPEDPFLDLFVKYSDEGQGQLLNPEGIQKLFEDAELGLDSVSPFLMAWACKAAEFAVIQKDEWERLRVYGLDSPAKLHAAMTDLENYFYHNTPIPVSSGSGASAPAKKATKGKKPKANGAAVLADYNTEPLRSLAGDREKTFKEFYQFCFGLMKKPEARVMEMEMATATWGVALQPKFPIMADLLEFITANPSYRSVNKDLWTMMFEFCSAVQSHGLGEWNDDESWPSLIDEFVAWKKSKTGVVDSQGDVDMS